MIGTDVMLFQLDILRLKEKIETYVNDVEMVYCFHNCSENIIDIEVFLKAYKNKVELYMCNKKSKQKIGLSIRSKYFWELSGYIQYGTEQAI